MQDAEGACTECGSPTAMAGSEESDNMPNGEVSNESTDSSEETM